MTSKQLQTSLGCLALSAVLAALMLAYEGTRLFQVLVLALPAGLWLCWPIRSAYGRALQALFAGTMGMVFITDGLVRAFLLKVYGASPAGTMVITAVANTTWQEVTEFMTMYGANLGLLVLFVLVSLAVLSVSLWWWWRTPWPPLRMSGWRLGALLLLLTLMLLAIAIKPWRQHHPVVFWFQWMSDVSSLRNQWADFGEQRRRLLANAQTQNPTITSEAPDTVVLIIGESINRGNLSLYGYPRETTPQLTLRQQADASRLGVFRHAWSVDASTIPALRNFFHVGQPERSQQHLLALASKAGYQTWWISNHDDLAIDQEHAQLADVVHKLNKTPGRSAQSLDEGTLPLLEQALQDQAPRKLIVLHLLGAHPHYRLRHPQDRAPFDHFKDQIYQGLKDQGRSSRVSDLRNDYDSAIHYHDTVVAATLDLTRKHGKKSVWVYFSDHGQEVGHVGEHVGHSAITADGYRVPVLLWGEAIKALSPQTFLQPLRTDWLGYSVLRLLGIDWLSHAPQLDVLDQRYQWTPPALEAVPDFRY